MAQNKAVRLLVALAAFAGIGLVMGQPGKSASYLMLASILACVRSAFCSV